MVKSVVCRSTEKCRSICNIILYYTYVYIYIYIYIYIYMRICWYNNKC